MNESFENFLKPNELIYNEELVDQVINESIIIDNLGSKENVDKFFGNMGNYASRDGLFSDHDHMGSHHGCCSHKAAILALAKNANDPDFMAFMKLSEAKHAIFERLEEKYGKRADIKISNQTDVLNSNDRVADAMQKTIGTSTLINPSSVEKCGL